MLKLSFGDKHKGQEYVRVYPRYEDNWDSETPISVEVKVLGPRAGVVYSDRIAYIEDRWSNNENKRQDAKWKALCDRLIDVCRPGSLDNVVDEDDVPVVDMAAAVENRFIPQELLTEILSLALDISRLKTMTEEAYAEYKAHRISEGASSQRAEREAIEGDEVGNSASPSGGTPGEEKKATPDGGDAPLSIAPQTE
jgi:hypothetical protein